MKMKIKNCHVCPFANDDGEYGKNQCNLKPQEIWTPAPHELPSDSIPDICPLLMGSVIVRIDKSAKPNA